MDRVSLSQGHYALVDSDLFAQIASFNWRILHAPEGKQARRRIRRKEQRLQFYVLELRGSPVPAGATVKFLNGDTLDCRTENLRVVRRA